MRVIKKKKRRLRVEGGGQGSDVARLTYAIASSNDPTIPANMVHIRQSRPDYKTVTAIYKTVTSRLQDSHGHI